MKLLKSAIIFLLMLFVLAFVLPVMSLAAPLGTPTSPTATPDPIPFNSKMSADKTVALANGFDEITLTVRTYLYKCSGKLKDYYAGWNAANYVETTDKSKCNEWYQWQDPFSPQELGKNFSTQPDPEKYKIKVSVNGTGDNMISPEEFLAGNEGYAYIKIKTKTPGRRSISISMTRPIFSSLTVPCNRNDFNGSYTCTAAGKVDVNFVEDPNKDTNTTTIINNTYNITLNSPIIENLVINGKEISINGNEISEIIAKGEQPTFSGTAKPNSVVSLTFRSTPFTDSTTSDANGNWKYTLTKSLEVGEHTIEATVLDPEAKEKSATSSPIKFKIADAKADASQAWMNNIQINNYILYALIAISIISVVLVIILIILYRKKHKPTTI